MNVRTTDRRHGGFTLIEMVGVLAVIAILAALLVPKIFAAIQESRINNAVGSINACKTAALNYFAKYGVFGNANGAAYTATELASTNEWDTILISTGFLEKPFSSRVGAASSDLFVRGAVDADPAVDNIQFNLDGDTNLRDVPTGSAVVYVKLDNVAIDDARELSLRIDGAGILSPTAGDDVNGRVKFDDANTTTVYIYLAHK